MALAQEETRLEPTNRQLPDAGTCAPAAPPPTASPPDNGLSGDDLRHIFARDFERLRGVARKYVSQKGLAQGAEVDEVALEIVSETFEQAHHSLRRFDAARAPSGDPLAWLYGIASTLVNNRSRARAKRPETSLSSIHDAGHCDLSEQARGDEEMFDHLARLAGQNRSPDVSQRLEAEASMGAMLALVSPDDAQVLRLAYEEDLDGAAIARRLDISHAAARQRLGRALKRLRRELESEQRLGQERRDDDLRPGQPLRPLR